MVAPTFYANAAYRMTAFETSEMNREYYFLFQLFSYKLDAVIFLQEPKK